MSKNKFIPLSGFIEELKCSHGNNGEFYRVSYGNEDWGDITKDVIKVQIINDKGIQGRKVPSFPIEDIDNVIKALEKIRDKVKTNT